MLKYGTQTKGNRDITAHPMQNSHFFYASRAVIATVHSISINHYDLYYVTKCNDIKLLPFLEAKLHL
jgi:hypothetical protein